jgi:hypothetical protein
MFLFGLLELEMVVLKCFFEKKELCLLGIRPCFLFFIFLFFYSDVSGSNECAHLSDFLKYDFYYFYGHANFCLCTLYFQYPSTLGNFLHHASQLQ